VSPLPLTDPHHNYSNQIISSTRPSCWIQMSTLMRSTLRPTIRCLCDAWVSRPSEAIDVWVSAWWGARWRVGRCAVIGQWWWRLQPVMCRERKGVVNGCNEYGRSLTNWPIIRYTELLLVSSPFNTRKRKLSEYNKIYNIVYRTFIGFNLCRKR